MSTSTLRPGDRVRILPGAVNEFGSIPSHVGDVGEVRPYSSTGVVDSEGDVRVMTDNTGAVHVRADYLAPETPEPQPEPATVALETLVEASELVETAARLIDDVAGIAAYAKVVELVALGLAAEAAK